MDIVKAYIDLLSKKSLELSKNTCHFLSVENDEPHPHSSGVLIKIEEQYCIITAKHVIDDMNYLYIGVGEHDYYQPGGRTLTLSNSDLDISALLLNQESSNTLAKLYSFVSIDKIDLEHSFNDNNLYLSFGYPGSYSKYNSYHEKLNSRPFQYLTKHVNDEAYNEIRCDKSSNFILHYEKSKVRSFNTGNINTGPNMGGVSGSGIWVFPKKLSDIYNHGPRLVGISTTWYRKRNYIVGVRINTIIYAIQQAIKKYKQIY